ncbi:hypothetical protein FACS1894110_09670 [Spirochaetia bacterium]|nr:hypothetical protein FACS1894110_09670 [Spirochaetia bacterium]
MDSNSLFELIELNELPERFVFMCLILDTFFDFVNQFVKKNVIFGFTRNGGPSPCSPTGTLYVA